MSRVRIASLVDDEANWPLLPKAFYLDRAEIRNTAGSVKNTALINDAFDADEACGQ